MDITIPVSTGNAIEVKRNDEITWIPDPRNKNGIILDIHEMAVPDKTTGVMPQEKDYLLITPDDGNIKMESLLPYIPQNGNKFQIALKRYNYKTVTKIPFPCGNI